MNPSKHPKRPNNDDDATSASTTSPQSKNEIQFKKLSLKKEIRSKCDKKLLTAASFEYQKQLNEQCEFNDEAIQEMAEKLNQLLTSPNKIERIATKFPKRTAVKVITALEKSRLEQPIASNKVQKKYYQRKDSYLMTSLSSLQESAFKHILKNSFYCHLLVAVCEGEGNNCSLCAYTKDDDYHGNKIINKRMIIINHYEDAGVFDDLKFTELSERFKKTLLSKKILFQGTLQTVESLIQQSDQTGRSLENVIDLDSMEELIQMESIEIPSLTSSRFEKSFYIPRRLTPTFPFSDHFWREVDKEQGRCVTEQLKTKCKVNFKGEIQWFVAHDKKSTIWEEMISLLKKRKSPICPSESWSSISEDDLLIDWNLQDKLPGLVIISGVAGTGKSSILSHYYEQIKEKDPGHWVILFNLSDHSKAFSKLDYRSIDKLTVVHFLFNLSVVSGQSKFARSLLKHRLETGDRIVIMLDGFDESHYKDNVILVINTLKEMKSVRIYVTTRSHMASYLQLQLSQLAYNLDNFSNEDQTNYLISLWKRDLKEVDENVQLFASSLVDLMTKTLKDEERVFIGIPLQCRILAECFESEVQRTNNQQEFDSLLEEIDRLNLNPPNLYSLIMENKQQIYIDEREHSDSSADDRVKTLQQFLRDLAIRTIVSEQDDVNLLLGNLPKTLPKLGDDCVCFGLLETNTEGKPQFSHRTYAEYFMAEYLYKGFLLDDNKDCRLPLVEKNAREFIKVSIILTKNHYAEVLVFFDSMLKQIVNGNINWREIINKETEMPLRFKIFTKLWKSTKNAQEILLNAIKNRNVNIFKFLFDCFDVTFDSTEFRKVMRSAIHAPYFQIFEIFSGENSSETFKRFIKHYEIAADKSEINRIFSAILRELPHTTFRDWDKEEKRKIVDLVLDFLLKHKETLKQIERQKRFEEILLRVRALYFFMYNYANQLRKWLELLSHLYANDDKSFAKLFIGVERQARLDCQNSTVNIRLTLTILLDIGRNVLLERICRLVLLWDYQAFESFYLFPDHTEQSQPLLSLTRLQQAAFNGATPTVMEIIDEEPETSKNELLGKYDTSEENKAISDEKSTEEFMDDDMVRTDQSTTPFYLAAARGHKEVCRKLMVLLKNDLLEGVIGALRDAIYARKIEMFELILKTVKEEMGQDYLLRLLKSKYPGGNTNRDLYWAAITLEKGDNDKKLWYRKVADIIVLEGQENEQHWDDLNSFVLRDQHSIKSLEHIDPETAKKMIMARGFENWIQRLLDIHIFEAFYFLFQDNAKTNDKLTCCMSLFDESRLSEFLVIFTSSTDGEGNSKISHWTRILQTNYAAEIFKRINYSSKDLLNSFLNYLELIFAKLSQDEINERLFDDEGIEAITRSLLKHGRESSVNSMLDFIAGGNKTDIKQHLLEKLIKEIENIIAPVTEEAKSQWILDGHVNIIWTRVKILVFITDNANYSKSLSALVCAILEQHRNNINETGYSIWNCYFDNVDGRSEEMALKKMDNFMKYVMDTSGESDVRKLVQGIIINALTHWNDSRLNVLLRHLMSDEKQTKEIGRRIVREAIEMMNLIGFYARVYYWKNVQQFVDYADRGELTKLIQIITQKFQISYDDKERSVWGSYLRDEYFYRMESASYVNEILPRNVNKFLECVSKKLGPNKVKELVFHEYNDLHGDKITAIQFAKSERKYGLVTALLTHLNKENEPHLDSVDM